MTQIPQTGVLFPAYPATSTMLVGCSRADYSASILARAVEDCGAHLLNLNITAIESEDWPVVVALRVDRLNPEPVVRSIERYGYEVIDFRGCSEASDEDLRRRAREFLHYLDI